MKRVVLRFGKSEGAISRQSGFLLVLCTHARDAKLRGFHYTNCREPNNALAVIPSAASRPFRPSGTIDLTPQRPVCGHRGTAILRAVVPAFV